MHGILVQQSNDTNMQVWNGTTSEGESSIVLLLNQGKARRDYAWDTDFCNLFINRL